MNDRRRFLAAGAGFVAGTLAAGGVADAATEQPATILHGAHRPRLGQGIVGDFYIDTRADAIYGPKRAHSGWGTGTSLVGRRGARGARGVQGLQGTPGIQGVEGPQGPRGDAGQGGYSVLHGVGAPAARLGVDNDFYIDTGTTQLYGPKEGGVWGSPVSLTGDANITAIDGGSL